MTQHVTMFDRKYSQEKQAEGIAISEAVAFGKCDECCHLKRCESDRAFHFPETSWCQHRKREILKEWRGPQEE